MKNFSIESTEVEVADKQDSLLDETVKNSIAESPLYSQQTAALVLGKIVDVQNALMTVELIDNVKTTLQISLTLVPLSNEDIDKICVVQFIQSSTSQPIIMGLLHSATQQALSPVVGSSSLQVIKDDDEELFIQCNKDIVLRCGKSQLRMTKDGVIQMRALYIDNQAKATHSIKGGSVKVN